MSSYSDSAQHRRRLVDEWRIEQAWRLLWQELARVVADADRALHDATRTLRLRDEAEERTGRAMVGGTGGPRDDELSGPDDSGMWTETCSMCNGQGKLTDGISPITFCHACGGTGRITYRSAQRVQADADAAEQAQRDSTLDFVRRYRASQAFTPEQRARYREMRALYEAGHYNTEEDR